MTDTNLTPDDLRVEVERLNAVCTRGAQTVNALLARIRELETERHLRRGELSALRRELATSQALGQAAARRVEVAEGHLHPAVAERLAALVDAGYHLWDVESAHGDGEAGDAALEAARLRWMDAMIRYDTARHETRTDPPPEHPELARYRQLVSDVLAEVWREQDGGASFANITLAIAARIELRWMEEARGRTAT